MLIPVLKICICFDANLDPDSAFLVNVGPDADPYPGFCWSEKWKKLHKKFVIYIFDPNCNLLVPVLLLKKSKLHEKPSALLREHPALQNLKFLHFCGWFQPSWIRIVCVVIPLCKKLWLKLKTSYNFKMKLLSAGADLFKLKSNFLLVLNNLHPDMRCYSRKMG
jgi:hypothetical protein